MAVACARVIEWIEGLAPKRLAEDWDNVGLQVGDPAHPVEKIYVALDVDERVVQSAAEQGCQMIVSHHPLFFKPMKTIRYDQPQGRLIRAIVKANLQVYSAHTNLDSARGGVNDILAQRLGLEAIEPLFDDKQEELVKIVVFVPANHEAVVRRAMGDAGAGHIGNYSHCAFGSAGRGTFLPLAGTTPFIGVQGVLEEVEEVRLETIVSQKGLNRVLKAMLKAHPYEEAAYDLYPLLNRGDKTGLGRVGRLPAPEPLEAVAERIKTKLHVARVRWTGADKGRMVEKIAVCGGSGASAIARAQFKGAQVLVTGDIKYHEAQTAELLGIDLIDAGHFATERPVLEALAAYLEERAAKEKTTVQVIVHPQSQDPFTDL
ncbi:Nif3-like dinuclear metal center hexameric protein [Heliobacterium gestii]|uniref:GTP cyclohydrolase 1 type 2 homolog n=1 Tax=Heliomicrobium gestii TaxID=2699 RepID=A0A845L869_HELGE|nr:Nif3-like dinuclear metal center hexameric protein [Heliomicrobium gestii]MBM7865530.1 dinuclear metal center YbgI/SA1388 family protein [Heliomicrobium gestii]MZP41781.1 Nif3-like dinuclear metal center hexameric protein [Heliomicrobium gestii]